MDIKRKKNKRQVKSHLKLLSAKSSAEYDMYFSPKGLLNR